VRSIVVVVENKELTIVGTALGKLRTPRFDAPDAVASIMPTRLVAASITFPMFVSKLNGGTMLEPLPKLDDVRPDMTGALEI